MIDPKKTRLIPLTKWNDFHPWPTVHWFRRFMMDKKDLYTNFLKKVGGRVIVDELEFFQWIDKEAEMNKKKRVDE